MKKIRIILKIGKKFYFHWLTYFILERRQIKEYSRERGKINLTVKDVELNHI